MTIIEIEDRIVEHLTESFPELKVEPFPSNPETYYLAHPKGAILVRYDGSEFEKPRATDVIVQDRWPAFQITIVIRQLRRQGETAGAYAYLDAVRLAMLGFTIEGFDGFWIEDEHFLDRDREKAIWQYAQWYRSKTMLVQASDEEFLPLLKRLTTESDYGTFETSITS